MHEEYQLYVLPRILESKKMAKSGRTKQKEADLEYNVAKQVEKMIRYIDNSCLNIIYYVLERTSKANIFKPSDLSMIIQSGIFSDVVTEI